MLKELKNLSPWQWDGKPDTVGTAIVDQFEKASFLVVFIHIDSLAQFLY